ncbi:hypothetical protein G7046_g4582 [Stylonectria norvegica]|nr:hypothetical protein G7046_g4582 [Stylonectria norvegica]
MTLSAASRLWVPRMVEQELLDGSAVVNLLDGPSDEVDAAIFGHVQDEDLSPEAVAKLHEALFASTTTESRWDDLLNFTPDFVAHPNMSSDAQLHLGTQDPTEARSIWLHQWNDVLSAYTDQVWGDLEPLAAEARREVEELTTEEAVPGRTPETKALDRLRQILAHVRGH